MVFVTDIDCVLCQVCVRAEEKFDELNITIEYTELLGFSFMR